MKMRFFNAKIWDGEKLFDAAEKKSYSDAEIREKRLHFGLVFQQFNLFPQYTVFRNITLVKFREDPEIFRTFVRTRKNEFRARSDVFRKAGLRGSERAGLPSAPHGISHRVRERRIAVGVVRRPQEGADLPRAINVV